MAGLFCYMAARSLLLPVDVIIVSNSRIFSLNVRDNDGICQGVSWHTAIVNLPGIFSDLRVL